MIGPKRESKICKLFNLGKEDDVRKYVNTYRRNFTNNKGKKVSKAPMIQRLLTPLTLERKERIGKANSDAVEYQKLLASKLKKRRDRHSESLAKKKSRLSSAAAKELMKPYNLLFMVLIKDVRSAENDDILPDGHRVNKGDNVYYIALCNGKDDLHLGPRC